MTCATTDYPILVAPRPLRLTSTYNALAGKSYSAPDGFRVGDANGVDELKIALFSDTSSDKDQASPRSSPRSGLPTEALEEFLSILRPSFFPPASPVLKARRQGGSSLPTLSQERSFPLKGRSRLEFLSQANDTPDELDVAISRQPSRTTTSYTPDPLRDSDTVFDYNLDTLPFRWYKSNVLSSPISRNHTRNPFLRHASDRSPEHVLRLSPASIPLPLPTPEEMVETA